MEEKYIMKTNNREEFLKYMNQMYSTAGAVEINGVKYLVSDIVVGFEKHSFDDGELIFNGSASPKGPVYKGMKREIKLLPISNAVYNNEDVDQWLAERTFRKRINDVREKYWDDREELVDEGITVLCDYVRAIGKTEIIDLFEKYIVFK